MPKLSGLIPVLAQVLAMPEKSVAIYARHLREARLITSGGRGPGGADMSPKDCSNLLIAILGGIHAKTAAKTVKKYRRVTASDTHVLWQLENLDLPGLRKLPAKHQFGKALDNLMLAAKDGSLEATLLAAGSKHGEHPIMVPVFLELGVRGPSPSALISFRAGTWAEDVTYAEPLPWGSERMPGHDELMKWSDKLEKEIRNSGEHGDLTQDRLVTSKTILALGNFLRA